MVRLKNRYILCDLVFHDDRQLAEVNVSTMQLQGAVQRAVHEIHGDYGVGAVAAGFIVKYVGAKTKTVLIKVRHRAVKFVTSSLPFVKSVQDTPCFLHTVHVAGTIRACQKFLVKHNRKQLAILYKAANNQDEKEAVLNAIKNCESEELQLTEGKDDLGIEDNSDYDSDDT